MSDELKAKEINEKETEQAAGGWGNMNKGVTVGRTYTTHVESGYLALRNYPAYDDSNIIGQLWNGSQVLVTSYNGGDYATVTPTYCAPGPWGTDVNGRVGYVNINYLQ